MHDDKGEVVRDVNVRQLLPWTELFRAFQIALEPYKLILAASAIVVLTVGWWLLAQIFSVPNSFGGWPPDAGRGANPFIVVTERQGDLLSREFWFGKSGQTSLAEEPFRQPPVHLEPLDKFIRPVTLLIKRTPAQGEWWYALFGLLLTLATWAIFGGAITRIAAVQIARNEKIGLMEALRFSVSKFVSFFSAPLIPFAGVALIAILLILGGFLFLIPWVGDFLASVLWFLPLLGGLIMALILIGLVGWPLMYATISTEGSDSFDALSRCYAYVFQRPWHFVFYSVIALAYGILVIFFVVFVTSFFVYLAKWGVGLTPGVSWRATGDPVNTLFYYAPKSYDWQRLLIQDHAIMQDTVDQFGHKGIDEQAKFDAEGNPIPDPNEAPDLATKERLRAKREQRYNEIFKQRLDEIANGVKGEPPPKGDGMKGAQILAASIVGFWLHVVFLLMLGFAYSYYWSASTIIYFLLRKRVDDTDMDEIYLEEDEVDSMVTSPPAPPPAPVTTPSLPAPVSAGAEAGPAVSSPPMPSEPAKSIASPEAPKTDAT